MTHESFAYVTAVLRSQITHHTSQGHESLSYFLGDILIHMICHRVGRMEMIEREGGRSLEGHVELYGFTWFSFESSSHCRPNNHCAQKPRLALPPAYS
jgi:hypothetical protein